MTIQNLIQDNGVKVYIFGFSMKSCTNWYTIQYNTFFQMVKNISIFRWCRKRVSVSPVSDRQKVQLNLWDVFSSQVNSLTGVGDLKIFRFLGTPYRLPCAYLIPLVNMILEFAHTSVYFIVAVVAPLITQTLQKHVKIDCTSFYHGYKIP